MTTLDALLPIVFLFAAIGSFLLWLKTKPPRNVQTCTRLAPHICKINGPCNGWPKNNT